jgi:hypothetical protein
MLPEGSQLVYHLPVMLRTLTGSQGVGTAGNPDITPNDIKLYLDQTKQYTDQMEAVLTGRLAPTINKDLPTTMMAPTVMDSFGDNNSDGLAVAGMGHGRKRPRALVAADASWPSFKNAQSSRVKHVMFMHVKPDVKKLDQMGYYNFGEV